MSEPTAHATVRAVWLAARAAVGLLRARWFAVLIAMVCVQGAVVWSTPLLVALLRWTLRRMSITGVNLDTLDTVVTSPLAVIDHGVERSEEHTSELQSRFDLVCRLPLEETR